ncbi:MAG: RDD family protein [Thermoplasmata archaeon]|nr:RDD family protein [Thermoplasmata archaeon]
MTGAVGLVSGGIAVTFLATESLPGLGIVSAFPYYLLTPLGVGILAVAIVEQLKLPPMSSLPLAYATATIGVLIGADVLRQPPLYGNGTPAIYVIGGAGPLDLLYLSGLMAVVGAWAFDWLVHRRLPRSASTASPPPATPESLLRSSVQLSLDGDSAGAVRMAGAAADAALDRTRRLLDAPPEPTGSPWSGLPVPPWVDMDHRNLRALVVSKERRPRDAARAWWTARWLVRLARDMSRSRFATPGRRFFAGLADFLLIAVPATVVWVSIVLLTGGPVTTVLTGVPLNAAAIGYAAWGFGYFVLAEHWYGTTFGKRLFHLAVTDRSLRRPAAIPALLRNTPKLIPLTVAGVVGAESVVLLLRGFGGLGLRTAASLLPEVTVVFAILLLLTLGVGIPTAAGAFGMSFSSENQRLGDLLAGTWVLNDRPVAGVPPGAAAPATPRSA